MDLRGGEQPDAERRSSEPQLEPFGARVLVEDPPAEEQAGKLVLPPGAAGLRRGVVVSTGMDRADDEMRDLMRSIFGMGSRMLEPGDVVYYRPDCGDEIGKQRVLDLDCIRAVERHR